MILPAVQPKKSTKIYLLGYEKPLTWKHGKQGVEIAIPVQAQQKLKGQPAFTFKIEKLEEGVSGKTALK